MTMLCNPLNRRVREHQGFPVLPGAFPLIGHLPVIRADLLNLLRRAEPEHGQFFWVDFGFGMRQLLCLHLDVLSLLKNKITESNYGELTPDLMGGTLIGSDGQPHRDVRMLMNGPFQPRGLTAAGIGRAFAGITENKIKAWHAGREICLLHETRELALTLMFRMLGIEETEFSVWRKQYGHLAALNFAPPIDLPGMPLRRGRRACDWMDGRLRGFIHEVRMRPDSPRLLAALVRSFDESDAALPEASLLANLRFLLFAGHETSASTMAWIVIMLAQRPGVWDALCAEATSIGTAPCTPKELASFPYAEAVFRETLRLYSPGSMFQRRALVDLNIAGRTVQAGTTVCIPMIHLSRHPGLHERPDEFVLERWLGRDQGVTPMEMMQFGSGPHFCLGYHLAWLEIVQFIVMLVLTMGAKGLRPRLLKAGPVAPIYLPLTHPPTATRVVFE